MSGAAELIYGLVSVRQLALVFGNTPQAVSAILIGLLGGMAMGSLAGGRRADRVRSPIRLYALLAIVLTLATLATPLTITIINGLYRGAYGGLEQSGQLVALMRLGLTLLVLGPATVSMGAILPTLTRQLTRNQQIAADDLSGAFGRLYAANILGALVGAVVTGVVLIELWGFSGALLVGAACSGVGGVAALALSRQSPTAQPVRPDGVGERAGAVGERLAYPTVALAISFVSGLTSVGYLTLWARLLASGTGSSSYAFTAILAVFLTGLAIGATAFGIVRHRIDGWVAPLAACQVAIAVLALVGLVLVISRPAEMNPDELIRTIVDPFRGAVLVVLPTTVLMGLAFAASWALLGDRNGEVAAAAGKLLAVNAIGAISGIVLIPFLVIPAIGSPAAVAFLALVNCATAFVLAIGRPRGRRRLTAVAASTVVALGLALSLVTPGAVLDPGVARVLETPGGVVVASAEDDVASVQAGSIRAMPYLWVAGTSITPLTIDARLMTVLALIARPNAQRALIVPFGMGSSFRMALVSGLTVDAVERVPSVPGTFGWFYPDASSRMAVPRGHVIIADGRSQEELTQQQYDVIETDPPAIESWDASAISSGEYYQAGHRLLTPGGLMVRLVPYNGTLDEFRNQLRTFRDAFPHTLVAIGPGGYGVLLLGSDAPIDFSESSILDVLGRSGVLANLSSAFDSPEQTVAGWVGRIPALVWLKDDDVSRFVGAGPLITDDHPLGEYFLLHRLLGSPSPRVTPAVLLQLSGQ